MAPAVGRCSDNVTWPLLTPSVNTNLLLNIIGSLQAWQLFLVLIGYRNGTQVLGYLVYAQGFGQTSGSVTSAFRQGYAAAASIVLFFVVLVLGMTLNQSAAQRKEDIWDEHSTDKAQATAALSGDGS